MPTRPEWAGGAGQSAAAGSARPCGIEVDPAGDLPIANRDDHRVLEIETAAAGSGLTRPPDATAGPDDSVGYDGSDTRRGGLGSDTCVNGDTTI